MATPSSILAWKIPRTEEPGGQKNQTHLATKQQQEASLSEFLFVAKK